MAQAQTFDSTIAFMVNILGGRLLISCMCAHNCPPFLNHLTSTVVVFNLLGSHYSYSLLEQPSTQIDDLRSPTSGTSSMLSRRGLRCWMKYQILRDSFFPSLLGPHRSNIKPPHIGHHVKHLEVLWLFPLLVTSMHMFNFTCIRGSYLEVHIVKCQTNNK